jgi:hypothetical protein
MSLVDPRGRFLTTESEDPVVVAVDVTGSMSSWPYEIFDRLPLLYQTLSQYRPGVEISFVAIGDATCDRYPLQVCDFARGIGLEDQLGAIFGEGGGGGGLRESYELFADFLLRRCRAPNARRPFVLIYGDEGFYETVDPGQASHYLGEERKQAVSSREVFSALTESWNLFHLRKPYGGAHDEVIEQQWADAIGGERIVALDSAERAVDLGLGLIARAWGHYDDFAENMSARQSDAAVKKLRGRLDEVEALT